MKKTALKILLAAVLLVVCSGVFYYVGEHSEQPVEVEPNLLSDGSPEWTVWHNASAGLMFLATPLTLAAVMIWSRSRNEEE
ncbi:MAG: hypothetical protein HY231_02925 [Acidobacteria bacterium]|nr:hypothetical protein [Acidobacteriota bacterium]